MYAQSFLNLKKNCFDQDRKKIVQYHILLIMNNKPGSFGILEPHDDTVNNLTIFAEVLTKSILSGGVA